MNIHDAYLPIGRRFRMRRMHDFERRFHISSDTRILDVGGTPQLWALLDVRPKILMLNLTITQEDMPENIESVIGDGTNLPYEDNSFDIVFSNSVIGHLGNYDNQQAFAKGIRRVGVSYHVQTPNRWFPVESHYLTPLIHYLPASWRPTLLRNFSVWGWITRPTKTYCEEVVEEIRLLNMAEMKTLFPEANLVREKVLGLTKSITAENNQMVR